MHVPAPHGQLQMGTTFESMNPESKNNAPCLNWCRGQTSIQTFRKSVTRRIYIVIRTNV